MSLKGVPQLAKAQPGAPADHQLLASFRNLAVSLLAEIEPVKLPFEPHAGPQKEFVESTADIVIFGGAAGSSKTWGLQLGAAQFMSIPGYAAIIFRRNMTDALKPGSLWPETFSIFPKIGGSANQARHEWSFPGRSSLTVAHLENEFTVYDYMGSQIPWIGFDELTHFSESQFWYMVSRCRSVSGGPSYIRGTCNPDPDSFVAKMVEWYIDQDTGLAIPERSGVHRYFVRKKDGNLAWANTSDELVKQYPDDGSPRSFTFIHSTLDDNPTLTTKDPGYKDRLKSLPFVERERLLGGNWKVRPAAGVIFNRSWFRKIVRVPQGVTLETTIRYWDNAGSESGRADRTAGVKMARGSDGKFYILGGIAFREEAPKREKIKLEVAQADGHEVTIWIEQEPGSSGKDSVNASITNLAGFAVFAHKKTGPKVTAWEPLAAQAEAGNVFVVSEPGEKWADDMIEECHNADGSDKVHDDYPDAASGAFNQLNQERVRGY